MTDDLEQLYQSTYTAVVRFLYRKVWDAERAEDLAQEVFVRALSHRPEKPRAWVFAVAANLARDEARAAMRRKRHLTLLKGDLMGIVRARHLSQATMRNIRQNLFFSFLYNVAGIPVAAGVLYPVTGLMLSPIIASAAMALSSVSVVMNSLRLRQARLA